MRLQKFEVYSLISRKSYAIDKIIEKFEIKAKMLESEITKSSWIIIYLLNSH